MVTIEVRNYYHICKGRLKMKVAEGIESLRNKTRNVTLPQFTWNNQGTK